MDADQTGGPGLEVVAFGVRCPECGTKALIQAAVAPERKYGDKHCPACGATTADDLSLEEGAEIVAALVNSSDATEAMLGGPMARPTRLMTEAFQEVRRAIADGEG